MDVGTYKIGTFIVKIQWPTTKINANPVVHTKYSIDFGEHPSQGTPKN